MPEVQGEHLDVSAEEERYLRRSFRRFALPWIAAGVALGAIAGALPGWLAGGEDGAAGPSDDPRLREEIAALRSDLAALSQRTVAAESALSRSRERLVALEGRNGETGGSASAEEVSRRIDAAMRRVEALEQQISGGAGGGTANTAALEERIAALGGRVARVEGELRAARPVEPPADFAR